MPHVGYYDLDFRPSYWWGPYDLETHYLSRIKGELRRASAPLDFKEGSHDEQMLEPSLDEGTRSFLGGIHPWLMGGEYLPDFLPTEVEIARAVLKSVTMDVISIRARRTKNRIIYRIVDEYPENPPYPLTQASSCRPLTFGQLINMIEVAGLQSARDMNLSNDGGDFDDVFDFVTLRSDFYPELARWYDEANEEWLSDRFEQRDEVEDEREPASPNEELEVFEKSYEVHRYPRVPEDQRLDEQGRDRLLQELSVGKIGLVECVMRSHHFTLEEALQALEDFGA